MKDIDTVIEETQFDGCEECGTNDEKAFEFVTAFVVGEPGVGINTEVEFTCHVCADIDEAAGFNPDCLRCHGLGRNVLGFRDYAGDPVFEACALCQWELYSDNTPGGGGPGEMSPWEKTLSRFSTGLDLFAKEMTKTVEAFNRRRSS